MTSLGERLLGFVIIVCVYFYSLLTILCIKFLVRVLKYDSNACSSYKKAVWRLTTVEFIQPIVTVLLTITHPGIQNASSTRTTKIILFTFVFVLNYDKT